MATKPQRPSRLTLELPPKARGKLEKLSEETDQSLSEVIRRALSLYDLIREELRGGGKVVLSKGETEREVILPEFAD